MAKNMFTAKWDGKCFKCLAPILIGDRAFFSGMDRTNIFGEDCCGSLTEAELMMSNKAVDVADDGMTVEPSSVMPRRAHVKDMCRKCFQIPSSNGVCGCVY